MKPRIKPIKDLYFRFIQGTKFEGRLDAQNAALMLYRRGLIELIANNRDPTISHYRDVDLNLSDKRAWDVFSSALSGQG